MGQKHCCGCFSLREGTLIILVLSTLSYIYQLFSNILNFEIVNINDNRSVAVKTLNIILFIVGVAFLFVGFIGVVSRKAICVKIYAFYYLISLIISIVLTAINLVNSNISPADEAESIGVTIGYILIVLTFLLESYFIYVFFAYSRELREEEEEGKKIAENAVIV